MSFSENFNPVAPCDNAGIVAFDYVAFITPNEREFPTVWRQNILWSVSKRFVAKSFRRLDMIWIWGRSSGP